MTTKRFPVRLGVLGLVLITALFVGLYSVARASTPSTWVATGEVKKERIATGVYNDNSQKYCTVKEKYEIFYRVTWPVKAFSYKWPVKTCWYKTNVGEVGKSGGRIYVTAPNDESVVRTTEENYNMFYPLGYNDKIAMTANNGSSFFRFLYIYDDFQSRLTLTTSSNVEQWNFDRQNPWMLRDASGAGLNMNHIGRSSNGDWLIVEGGNGFMRINAKTKETLTFERQLYGYGYGLNPTYELTISDSGRYAIVSGGNLYTRDTHIYDLSTCQPVQGAPLSVATGCVKRDLKKDVFPQLTAAQTLSNAIFSGDETNITVSVPGAYMSDQYVIAAPGHDVFGMEYLALGDSYSSGEGETNGRNYYMKGTDGDGEFLEVWNTGLANFPYKKEKCHLSIRAYPFILSRTASLTERQFNSIACSGSTTTDLIGPINSEGRDVRYNGSFSQLGFIESDTVQQNVKYSALTNYLPGREKQIEFVSRYKPRVATVGIGGNDIQFSNKLKECITSVYTCSSAGDLRPITGKDVQQLYTTLTETYSELYNASKATKFYAVGYPEVVGDEACDANVLLDSYEKEYAKQLVKYLNTVVKAAAKKEGFGYLDISQSLNGRRLCDTGKPAVNALTIGNDIVPLISIDDNQYLHVVGNESFHPTPEGHVLIAESITNLLGASINNSNPCGSLAVSKCASESIDFSIPAYFQVSSTQKDLIVRQMIVDYAQNQTDEYIEALKKNTQHSINLVVDSSRAVQKLWPNQTLTIIMHSTPKQVGTMTTDSNGNITGSFTVPSDIEPGYHTLLINAKDSLYQDIALYQQIFVYDSLEDFDGDGTLNTDEKCGVVEPIHKDEDRDGVDDACDGIIDIKPDTTPPTITAQLSQQANENGWHKDDVKITWSVKDDTDTEFTAPAEITANREGEHTYSSAEVCDTAGNCTTGSATIKLDKTAPKISGRTTDNPNRYEWLNHDTSIEWTATDDMSVVTNPPMTAANQEGEHVYNSAEVCDQADNCNVGEITVKIDKTAPLVSMLSFSKNPKSVDEHSVLSTFTQETSSGIVDAEYYIGEDPGLGNGATLLNGGNSIYTTFGTDFGTGVYKITVRVQDYAGNWSTTLSDYLVVYDATSGVRLRGARWINLLPSTTNLPWLSSTTATSGKFAFSVRYGADGNVTPQSDFQFAYKTGDNCNKQNASCHNFEFNATSIKWLTITGSNQETGIFSGLGSIKSDAQVQPVAFVVYARDGERLSPTGTDNFSMTLYPEGSSFGTSLLHFVAPTDVGRGNIKIKF